MQIQGCHLRQCARHRFLPLCLLHPHQRSSASAVARFSSVCLPSRPAKAPAVTCPGTCQGTRRHPPRHPPVNCIRPWPLYPAPSVSSLKCIQPNCIALAPPKFRPITPALANTKPGVNRLPDRMLQDRLQWFAGIMAQQSYVSFMRAAIPIRSQQLALHAASPLTQQTGPTDGPNR